MLHVNVIFPWYDDTAGYEIVDLTASVNTEFGYSGPFHKNSYDRF